MRSSQNEQLYLLASRVKSIRWTVYRRGMSYWNAWDLPKWCVFLLTNIHPDIQYPQLITQWHVVKGAYMECQQRAPLLNVVQMWPWTGTCLRVSVPEKSTCEQICDFQLGTTWPGCGGRSDSLLSPQPTGPGHMPSTTFAICLMLYGILSCL